MNVLLTNLAVIDFVIFIMYNRLNGKIHIAKAQQ